MTLPNQPRTPEELRDAVRRASTREKLDALFDVLAWADALAREEDKHWAARDLCELLSLRLPQRPKPRRTLMRWLFGGELDPVLPQPQRYPALPPGYPPQPQPRIQSPDPPRPEPPRPEPAAPRPEPADPPTEAIAVPVATKAAVATAPPAAVPSRQLPKEFEGCKYAGYAVARFKSDGALDALIKFPDGRWMTTDEEDAHFWARQNGSATAVGGIGTSERSRPAAIYLLENQT